jgi:lipopolysaccharide/colanic/teichoic acid biosynthesis glycosyltransferase
MYRTRVKRAVDVVISVVVLALFLPLWVVIGVAVALDSPGRFLFGQERVGYHGKVFKLLKFRTMVEDAHLIGKGYCFQGENDPRITRIGRLLRRTSLDEIPQLANVITGEMRLGDGKGMRNKGYWGLF